MPAHLYKLQINLWDLRVRYRSQAARRTPLGFSLTKRFIKHLKISQSKTPKDQISLLLLT